MKNLLLFCLLSLSLTACQNTNEQRNYISEDPDQCAVIRFVCEDGQNAFFDDSGCGCENQ